MERGILIVTGSCLQAELADRFLAYRLKEFIEKQFDNENIACPPIVIVLSDLWYLNTESLHELPMISVGSPHVNAVSAHLVNRLPRAVHIEKKLIIQMDLDLRDRRVTIWGCNGTMTGQALQIFTKRGYLARFLEPVLSRNI